MIRKRRAKVIRDTIDRMIKEGRILPSHREEAERALDRELRRGARRIAAISARSALKVALASKLLKSAEGGP